MQRLCNLPAAIAFLLAVKLVLHWALKSAKEYTCIMKCISTSP